MIRWYLETSAALKLIVDETESDAMVRAITDVKPDLIGCRLLETEMRRIVARHPQVSQELVTDVLEEIDLVEMPSALFRQARYLPGPHLRTLDALHLAAAMRADVDLIVTYDARLAESARSVGLRVLSPARVSAPPATLSPCPAGPTTSPTWPSSCRTSRSATQASGCASLSPTRRSATSGRRPTPSG